MFRTLWKIVLLLFMGGGALSGNALDGFMIGGTVGANLTKGHHEYINTNPTTGVVLANDRGRMQGLSYLMEAQAGFTGEFNHMLVGGEAYVAFPGGEPSRSLMNLTGGVDGMVTMKCQQVYGAALLVGMEFNPCIGAGLRGGLEHGTWKASYTQFVTGTTASPSVFARKKAANGFLNCFWGNYKFSRHFLIGINFDFPFYKKLKLQSDAGVVDGRLMALYYKPQQFRLGVRFIFRF